MGRAILARMATRKKRKKTPAAPSTRWAGLTPEERSQKMSELSQRSKFSAEDRAAIAWLRENHDLMAEIVANFAAYKAQAADLAELTPLDIARNERELGSDERFTSDKFTTGPARVEPAALAPASVDLPRERATVEPPPLPPQPPVTVAAESVERSAFVRIARGGFICTGCGSKFTTLPESCGTCSPAAKPERARIDFCSVCMGPIYDLDSPCETCIQAGRLTPGADPAELHKAQAAAASPWGNAPTVHDVPRVSNHGQRAELPKAAPPLRAYSAQETCLSCGRIAELHESHGGPIGHGYQAQPPPPPAAAQ